jgi:uncharacterized protein YyaL (SSP411 family)
VRIAVGEEDVAALAKVASFIEGKTALGGKPTAYVCERGACQLPTHDPAAFVGQLARPPAR